jgi:hypothetical protein
MKTRGYRNLGSLFSILSLVWGTMVWIAPVSASPAESPSGVTFSRPPLRFEMNEGQLDPQVRFIVRDRNGIAFLTSGGAVLQIFRRMEQPDSQPYGQKMPDRGVRGFETSSIRLNPLAANPTPRVIGIERLPGVTNYLTGNNRLNWRSNVGGYAVPLIRDVGSKLR